MEWSDTTPPCENCQNYKKPICKTCFVKLDPRNMEAVNVFNIVRHQYITIGSLNFPICVRVEAVMAAMELFNIQEKEKIFLRVNRAINTHFIKKIQAKIKPK